jgi:hypothetical protein
VKWIVVLLVALTGCSFVWREKVHESCTTTPMHVDLGIASAAAVGAGIAALAITCNDDKCNQEPMVDFVIGPALVVGIAALAATAYGYDTQGRCEDARK